MGSAGWVPCYWCQREVYNPYALDIIGGNFLCAEHFDYLVPAEDSWEWEVCNTRCPIQPAAMARREAAIQRHFRRHRVLARSEVARAIAGFLHAEWER